MPNKVGKRKKALGCFLHEWVVQQIKEWQSDDCLLWPYVSVKRYPSIKLPHLGMQVSVHRLVFFLTHGHWPTPLARHTCDVKLCFNPRHIIEGTHADNMRDAAERNRMQRGADRPAAKLTEDAVRTIRLEYPIHTLKELGAKYGVHYSVIWDVVNRKTWKHVL